ncbi:DUF7344 domain-containing protein [Natronorubrum thiooxidans]|uniref:DUF7344 domain-containing protein n=1 Tax=Natronorubrum thiooxidans TaxID=308853 RepID=A0A1N7E758_9EURY|nr:hypothetical protein [Natronorubrum thiooxidans]SIR83884.1 hypothetical protein SAMN05421752_103262 [Natronorubrum thiooxidans]
MSSPDGSGRPRYDRDGLFSALADETRREGLQITHEQSPTGLTKAELAAELVSRTAVDTAATVTDDDRQRALVDCHHRLIPALADADLITEFDDRIVATDHWAFDDAELMTVIAGQTTDYGTDLDALFEALADARRRTTITVLEDRQQPLSVDTLAREITASEATPSDGEDPQDRIEQTLSTLTHVHLPILHDSGLIGYDAPARRVSYEGHPMLHAGWLEETHERGSHADTRDRLPEPGPELVRSGIER